MSRLSSLFVLIVSLAFFQSNQAQSSTLRLVSASVSASIVEEPADGATSTSRQFVRSTTGSATLSGLFSSSIASADLTSRTMRLQAIATSTTARNVVASTTFDARFLAEGGDVILFDGFLQGAFETRFSRSVTNPPNASVAQTRASHLVNTNRGGGGASGRIEIREVGGLPPFAISSGIPEDAPPFLSNDSSVDGLTTIFSTRSFVVREGEALDISVVYQGGAITSGSATAISNGANSFNFLVTVPESVELLGVPSTYSWIVQGSGPDPILPIPLPATILMMLPFVSLIFCPNRRRRDRFL